jgi:uncharacterized protein (TIGR03083 family)
MPLSTADCLDAIEKYSSVLADSARDHLAARVEHCPGWDVADLVRHVADVHWFWGTIAEDNLPEPPDESLRPGPVPDGELVDAFERGAARLVEILGAADQSASCWTWFPAQQDVAFITRHQVQEAAVHAWDAANATGRTLLIDPAVASDSVDEFLTTSLADVEDAERDRLTALSGTFALHAADTGDTWTVTDGSVPGSLRMRRGNDDEAPSVTARAHDLLLWLYERAPVDTGEVPGDLLTRFRGLSSTD